MNVFRRLLNFVAPSVNRVVINPGAECEVICQEPLEPGKGGHFITENGRSYIVVGYSLTKRDFILLHEYQHLIEWTLRYQPAALKMVRHAFRSLNTPAFEIGHDDLMEELR